MLVIGAGGREVKGNVKSILQKGWVGRLKVRNDGGGWNGNGRGRGGVIGKGCRGGRGRGVGGTG